MSGLTGHIDHLYEDPNLTLEDIVKIYRKIANNSKEIPVYEKLDGYNIYLSYSAKENKAKLLRNNGQIKTGGITLQELKSEFTTNRIQAGKRPVPTNIVSVYTNLIGFFEKIVPQVFTSPEQKKLVFGEDASGNPEFFFNAELIDPYAPNVIKYDRKMIIFHKLGNVKINAEKGSIIASDTDEVNLRFNELSKIFGDSSKENGIQITDDKESKMDLVNMPRLEEELGKLRSEFRKLGLDMNDTVGKYFIKSIEKYLVDKKLNLDNHQTEFVVKSVLSAGFGSKHVKKPRINEFFTTNSMQDSGKIKELTNEEPARDIFKQLRSPIDKTIFNCSSILLDMYESRYITDNKQTADDIIKLVNNAIENINSKGTAEQKNKLNKQLDKLKHNTIGFKELVNNPVEGVVFRYKDHTYKITSTFGPVNQIINMSNFEHRPLNENKTIEANGMKVLYAGAFKPPHRGHLQVIKSFIELPKYNNKNFVVEKVIVIVGDKARFSTSNKEFPLKQSMELFKLYLESAGLQDLVELRVTKRENPVKDVYDYIANSDNDLDKAQPGDVILLGVSRKDRGYYSNLSKFVKDKPWQILFGEDYEIPVALKGNKDETRDILGEYASTEFRNAISNNDLKTIKEYLPEEILSSPEYLKRAYNILGVQVEVEELKESSIIKLINKELTKPQPIQPKLNLGDLISRVNSIYNKRI
jgi:nicotinamide mononucleotide adenylyltransferase